MQFPTFSKNDSASDASGSTRIEPTIGESKPSPWDVTPESAPAFEMVDDPAEQPRQPEPTPPEESGVGTWPAEPAERSEPSSFVAKDLGEGDAAFSLPSSETVSRGVQPPKEEVPVQVTEPATSRMSASPAEEKATPSESVSSKKENGFLSFLKRGGPAPRSGRRDEEHDVPSEEQLLAREKTRFRLVGAAALLMGLVVVSSFLLDNEALVKNEARVSTDIPPVPEAPAVSTEVPTSTVPSVPAPTVQEVTKVDAPEVADASKKSVAPVTAEPAKKVQPVKEVKTDKKPPVKETAAKTGSGYFIQLVVTSSEQKAEKMVHDLKRLKLPAYQERIQGKKGPLWRVRIGHFKTEKDAKNTVAVLALNGYTGNHYIDKQ